MMKVRKVRHKVLIEASPHEIEGLKEALTFRVKDFEAQTYTTITAYEETDEGLWIPRYYRPDFPDVEEREWPEVKIDFFGELNDLQKALVDKWFREKRGIISSGTGSGKTVMALYIAHKLGLKTLVVVPTRTLFLQWIQRVKQFCGFYPETIQGAYCSTDTPIVIGMLKTLAMGTKIPRDKLYTAFGLVIYDEVHRVGAPVYNVVSGMFWDRYRLGLSATPKRADGMEKLFIWNIGPILTSATMPQTMKPKVYIIKFVAGMYPASIYTRAGEFKLARFLNYISGYEERNKLIAYYIFQAYRKGRNILVLSDRLNQLETLARMLRSLGVEKFGFLTGNVKNFNDCRIILATYGAGGEGFDLPQLDCLVMASPRADVRQAIGRILRPKDRTPIVVDIVDAGVSEMRKFAMKRLNLYKSMKFDIVEKFVDRGGIYCAYKKIEEEKERASV